MDCFAQSKFSGVALVVDRTPLFIVGNALTFLLVAGLIFAPRNGDIRNGGAAMANNEGRSSDDRRSSKDRRSGTDTRSEEERRLIGERRSNSERRSGLDRRSSNRAGSSPISSGRDTH
jgi:hypothetical protein